MSMLGNLTAAKDSLWAISRCATNRGIGGQRSYRKSMKTKMLPEAVDRNGRDI